MHLAAAVSELQASTLMLRTLRRASLQRRLCIAVLACARAQSIMIVAAFYATVTASSVITSTVSWQQ